MPENMLLYRAPIKILGLLAAITLTGLVIFHFHLKGKLDARAEQVSSIIHSESVIIWPQTAKNPGTLLERLRKRNYQQVDKEAFRPGEFRTKGEYLELYRRAFTAARSTHYPAELVSIHLPTGKITSASGETLPFLKLEPLPLAEFGEKAKRTNRFRSLERIPQVLQDAVIATEDRRFFEHPGIDIEGITRAFLANLKAGAIVQGGSTITQQLAKNLFLSPHRTFRRKAMEALSALSLELWLTKEEILEMYLNEVYLGQDGSIAVHGVAAATQFFFQKDVEEISTAEAALLAGIIKAPSTLAPHRHRQRALQRRNTVLSIMAREGFLTPKEAGKALAEPLLIELSKAKPRQAEHFLIALRQQLDTSLGRSFLELTPANVYTGIDPSLQQCAQSAVSEGLDTLLKQRPHLKKKKLQAALVALDPVSGKVRSWVGSKDYRESQFDHVISATRPVGSLIKPFVYLTALDRTLNDYKTATTRSILKDEPLQIKLPHGDVWEPQNYDKKFRGSVTLRHALETSLNVPTAYLAQRVGIPAVVETIKRFRIVEKPPALPSIALGTVETSLLRMTSAYAGLANDGIYAAPRLYIDVLDQKHEKSLATSRIDEQRVAQRAPVFIVTNILQGVVERGTGRGIRARGYTAPAAGKTGTSDNYRDSWFIGYTPNLAAGVWVGADDFASTGLTGASGAVPLWTRFMRCATPFVREESFAPPADVIFVKIDPSTDQRFDSSCPSPQSITEVFVAGTEPQLSCGDSVASFEKPPSYRPTPEPRRSRSFWDILFGTGE